MNNNVESDIHFEQMSDESFDSAVEQLIESKFNKIESNDTLARKPKADKGV